MYVSRYLVCVLSAACWFTSHASAQVNFSFNFNDVAGVGFNDATEGAARRAALQQGANIVSSLFENYDANIVLDVTGDRTGNSFLATAQANFNSPSPGPGFDDLGDVQTKILFGDAADPSAAADGMIEWNFDGFQWETGNDFQANEVDLISTAAHELLHTVGFFSTIGQNGEDVFGTPAGQSGTWSAFDEFVADSNGFLINDDYELDGARWDIASVGGTGDEGLFFIGANAVAANGGNPVNLFSPARFAPGSSVSHLDDEFFGGSFLEESSAGFGLGIRTVSNLERAILRDIGFTLVPEAVPEPSSIILLLALGGVVSFQRRRD